MSCFFIFTVGYSHLALEHFQTVKVYWLQTFFWRWLLLKTQVKKILEPSILFTVITRQNLSGGLGKTESYNGTLLNKASGLNYLHSEDYQDDAIIGKNFSY